MKNGWQQSTLGEVLAVLRNGVNCKQNKSGQGDKVSRIESISDATFDVEKVGFAPLSERDKDRFRLQRGDILFSHINSAIHVGKTAIFDSDEDVYHGVNLLLMRPKDDVLPAFLEYSLKHLFLSGYWCKTCKQSVNQASVNQQDVSRVEFRYPKSLPEQRRIVGILDEAFAGIATAKANAEKNLQNARALFESHLNAVFTQRGDGWEQKRLEEVVTEDCSLSYGIVQPGDDQPDGLPIVRPTDFTQKLVKLNGLKRIDPQRAESYQRTKLRGGELLLCVRGATGGVAIAAQELAGANVTRGIVPFRFLGGTLDQRFGFYSFLASPVREQIREKTTGTALMQINIRDLRCVRIQFPPMNEQCEIASRLDTFAGETQRLESIYQRKLAALDELKKSLLHQAFSGQLQDARHERTQRRIRAMTWQPTCITQFVEARKSSTMVVIVETDAGRGFLKAMGNPEGEHALACDWVGTQLAKWFGLPTLDQRIVEFDGIPEITLFNGDVAREGPALVTRAVNGDSWSGEPRQLGKLQNLDDISRLVVFDTWILNRDRHYANRQNRDNVFLSAESEQLELLAIDHTHCFGTSGGVLTERVTHIGNYRDCAVYGLFPEFKRFLIKDVVSHAVEQLARIDEATIKRIVADIPDQWHVPEKAKSALVSLVLQRAAYVADTIYEKLWPQKELDFMDESED